MAQALLVAMLLWGCATAQPPAAMATPPRIVSLAPSLTEIVYAIGAGGALVGDTSTDDYPAPAKLLPHVADLANNVDLERLAALRPTVVLALHDQEREGSAIASHIGVPIVYLPNRRLRDLRADILGAGRAAHRSEAAKKVADRIDRELQSIARHHAGARPRVFFLLGLPGYTAGRDSFITDAIEIAGGVNVAGSVAQPYPNVSAESLLKTDPDVLLVARESHFTSDVRSTEPWRSLRAVREGRVIEPPDDSLLERNGPRLVQGVRWLAQALRVR